VGVVPLLGIGVIVVNTWRPLREAGHARVRLERRFGPPGSYTPQPSGELKGDRIEAFLDVRRALQSSCDRYEPLREAFQYIDGLDESREPVAKDIWLSAEYMFDATRTITPFVGLFFQDRNRALEAAAMSLEEYSYVYACAYREQLSTESVRAEVFFDDVPPSLELMDSFHAMLARQHDASEGEMKRALAAELAAQSEDPGRFPWQDGLPQATARSLLPYRAELDSLFCAGTAGIEMDRDSGRALRIALE
jgi:hypothetical protein